MSDFDDNMNAVVDYFNRVEPKTSSASKTKTAFATWYNNLGWTEKNINTEETWNKARNFRMQFDRENVSSSAEKQAVIAQQKNAFDASGKPQSAKTSEGLYATSDDDKPLIPPEYKWAVIAVAAGGVLIFAYGLSSAIPAGIAALLASKRMRHE